MKDISPGWLKVAVLLFSMLAVNTTLSQVVPMSLSGLASNAKTILHGKVQLAETRWTNDERGRHIYTSSTIQILEVMKGTLLENPVVISTIGGTVGDTTEWVSSSFSLEEGEEVVLFLGQNQNEVVGGFQGRLTVSHGQIHYGHKEIPLDHFVQAILDFVRNPAGSTSLDNLEYAKPELKIESGSVGPLPRLVPPTFTPDESSNEEGKEPNQSKPKSKSPSTTLTEGVARAVYENGLNRVVGDVDGFKPPSGSQTQPSSTQGWVAITTETFEGTFPNGLWQVASPPSPSVYWDDQSYLAHTGTWSAWCADGGTDALPASGGQYLDNMDSWMVYGPFDLSDAADAELLFSFNNNSESGFDYFMVTASIDNSTFYGLQWSGNTGGWVDYNFDLTNVNTLGDITGQSQVWIAFIFQSDASVADYPGAFVDDVVIQKYTETLPLPEAPTLVSPPNGSSQPGTSINFAWQGVSTATEYWLQVANDASFSGLVYDNTVGNYVIVDMTGFLGDGTRYYWRVRARNATGWGPYSSAWSFVNSDVAPVITAISPPKASAGTNTSVTITGDRFGAAQGTGTVDFFYRNGEPKISAGVTSWSNTQIVCTVPIAIVNGYSASAGSGPVTVTDNSGLTSPEYTFLVSFGNGGIRWAGTNPVIQYRINENYAGATGEGAQIQNAATSWSVAGAPFALQYVGTTSATVSTSNGSNEVCWGSLEAGVLGEAAIWSSAGYIVECDFTFNQTYQWSTDGTPSPSEHDVQTIALHELGHWLMLRDLYGNVGDNIHDSGKIMYGFGSPGSVKRVLHADDIAGIRWIYGAGTPGPTLTSISPNSGNRLQTLNVVFTGTNFIGGVSSVNVGSGIIVNSTTVNSPTQLTANLTITSSAATGGRSFSVTNAGGGTSGNQTFTVNNLAGMITTQVIRESDRSILGNSTAELLSNGQVIDTLRHLPEYPFTNEYWRIDSVDAAKTYTLRCIPPPELPGKVFSYKTYETPPQMVSQLRNLADELLEWNVTHPWTDLQGTDKYDSASTWSNGPFDAICIASDPTGIAIIGTLWNDQRTTVLETHRMDINNGWQTYGWPEKSVIYSGTSNHDPILPLLSGNTFEVKPSDYTMEAPPWNWHAYPRQFYVYPQIQTTRYQLLLYMTNPNLSTPGRTITAELFNSEGSLIATQVGALDSNVYPMVFDGITPQSGCSYRVWYNTVSTNEIFGREYLGGGRGLDFSDGSITNIFSRSSPQTANITIEDSITGRPVRGDTTEVGRRLRVRLYTDVPSGTPPPPGPQRYYGTEVLDRDKTPPYDFVLESDYYTGGGTAFTFYITPVQVGNYFGVAGCILDLDGVPTTSEGGRWVSGPLFTVVAAYIPPPPPPELVSPSSGTAIGESVVAVWRKVSDAESYELQVASDSLFASVVFDTTLTDTMLLVAHGGQVGTRFWWRVKSFGNSKWGQFGDVWNFTFLTFPTAAQLLSPQNGKQTSADSVVALWYRSTPDVDSYNYQLSADSLFTVLALDASIGDTSVVIRSLSDGRYWLRVRAHNIRGWGSYGDSHWFTRTTILTPPQVELQLPPDDFISEDGRITMKWLEPSSGIAKYMLEVATNSLFVNPAIDSSITVDSSVIEGMTLGQQYWWRVRARNIAGWGPPSSSRRFMYLTRPPAVTLSSPADGALLSSDSVQVTWDEAQPMVDRYWCEIASDSLFTLKAVDSMVVEGSYVFGNLASLRYWWRVRAHNRAGWGDFGTAWSFSVNITDVVRGPGIPTEFILYPNYPNPFNPSTEIRYALPTSGSVSLMVFNSAGQEVATLVSENMQPGTYAVRWDAKGMPSGVYFFRLVAGEFVDSKKMVLIK